MLNTPVRHFNIQRRRYMEEAKQVYDLLIESWNNRDAEGMSSLFTEEGESIGFDGSHSKGPEEITKHLAYVFKSHPTPPFVTKVKEVRSLGSGAAMLRAIAGMIPPGEDDIESSANTHHTLVIVNKDSQWKIELFQNTPAQFHGHPELVHQMTNELRKEIE